MQNGSGTNAEAILPYIHGKVMPRFGMLADPYLEVMANQLVVVPEDYIIGHRVQLSHCRTPRGSSYAYVHWTTYIA